MKYIDLEVIEHNLLIKTMILNRRECEEDYGRTGELKQ